MTTAPPQSQHYVTISHCLQELTDNNATILLHCVQCSMNGIIKLVLGCFAVLIPTDNRFTYILKSQRCIH